MDKKVINDLRNQVIEVTEGGIAIAERLIARHESAGEVDKANEIRICLKKLEGIKANIPVVP